MDNYYGSLYSYFSFLPYYVNMVHCIVIYFSVVNSPSLFPLVLLLNYLLEIRLDNLGEIIRSCTYRPYKLSTPTVHNITCTCIRFQVIDYAFAPTMIHNYVMLKQCTFNKQHNYRECTLHILSIIINILCRPTGRDIANDVATLQVSKHN